MITRGAVDVSGLTGGIPNSLEGTVPGDGVLVRWRDLELQLPRTNNAGAPSYTDGRWWWRVVDASAPEFAINVKRPHPEPRYFRRRLRRLALRVPP